jgi:PAS domain S-box-containing protein
MAIRTKIQPTGRESPFAEDEFIVSKTDVHGKMVYVNEVFLRVSRFQEEDVLGQPHSMIRHPQMPRGVFKLMWDTIQSGKEIFAYVVNLCSDGDHYWVFAHVTPTFDARGNIIGFHSNRRKPDPKGLAMIQKVYAEMSREESRHAHPRAAAEASVALLNKMLQERGTTYAEMMFALWEGRA